MVSPIIDLRSALPNNIKTGQLIFVSCEGMICNQEMWRNMIYAILFLNLLSEMNGQQSSSLGNVDKVNHQVIKRKCRFNERYELSYWQAMKCQAILNTSHYILMWNKSSNGTISLVKLNGTNWTRFHSSRMQLQWQSRLPLQLTSMAFNQPNLDLTPNSNTNIEVNEHEFA
jgi:hypothetical protein